MAGIVFLRTASLDAVRKDYLERVGMDLWLDQGGCLILKHGNMLIGFCESEKGIDTEGMLTFFYESREDVDAMYTIFKETAETEPRYNERYNIYQFFAKDFEGRALEFQKFCNDSLPPYATLSEGLQCRRSIRQFEDKAVNSDVLNAIFEDCRYSPTSRNCQSYYYVLVKNPSALADLAAIRDGASAPIGRAPLAVAVCVDTDKTKRIEQDADIAGTYLLLAAHNHGLGTCWITDMDREEVKSLLNIPQKDYVSMITPLGYSAEATKKAERRSIDEFVRIVE